MDEPISYQTCRDGPLKPEVIKFLDDLRVSRRMTYKMLGDELGISIAFIHHVINKNARVSTDTTMPRIADGIGRLMAVDTRTRLHHAALLLQDNMREHVYHLREDLVISMSLPRDITERESERLALFVRSLAT